MHTSARKSSTKVQTKEDSASKKSDEKLKTNQSISTPRNFVQKSSTVDIYAQKKRSTLQSAKAPKKIQGTSHSSSNVSPMKDLLKSSPSSISQISARSSYDKTPKTQRKDPKAVSESTKKTATPRISNVTVNSPVAKRRLNLSREPEKVFKKLDTTDGKSEKVTKKYETKEFVTLKSTGSGYTPEYRTERQRTKTRTLDENEVKVLTPDVVDNNAEMLNLTRKLSAKPKSFYVDLDEDKTKVGLVYLSTSLPKAAILAVIP